MDTTLVRYHTRLAEVHAVTVFPKNMMMMYQQFSQIRYVSPGVVPVPTPLSMNQKVRVRFQKPFFFGLVLYCTFVYMRMYVSMCSFALCSFVK